MKAVITKAVGHFADELAVGEVHLHGGINSTFACGLAVEDYDYKVTTKPVSCEGCKTLLKWAKEVYKIKS